MELNKDKVEYENNFPALPLTSSEEESEGNTDSSGKNMENLTVEELRKELLETREQLRKKKKEKRRETVYLPSPKPVKVNVSTEEVVTPKFPSVIDSADFKRIGLKLEEVEKARAKLQMSPLDLCELVTSEERDSFIDKFFDGDENKFTSPQIRKLIEDESKYVNEMKKADWENEVRKALKMNFSIKKTDLRISDYVAQGKRALREVELIDLFKKKEPKFLKQLINVYMEKLKPRQLKVIMKNKDKTAKLHKDWDKFMDTLKFAAAMCDTVYQAGNEGGKENGSGKTKQTQNNKGANAKKTKVYQADGKKRFYRCTECGEEGHLFIWKRYNKEKKKYEFVRNRKCQSKISGNEEQKAMEKAIKEWNRVTEEFNAKMKMADTPTNENQGSVSTEAQGNRANLSSDNSNAESIIKGLKNITSLSPAEKEQIYAQLSGFVVTVDAGAVAKVNMAVNNAPEVSIEYLSEDGTKGHKMKAILDSGAQLTFIGKREYRELKQVLGLKLIEFSLPFPIKINDANGGSSSSYFGITGAMRITVNKEKLLLKNATSYIVDNDEFKTALVGEDILTEAGMMPWQNLKSGEINFKPEVIKNGF